MRAVRPRGGRIARRDALARRGANLAVARGVITDELRRRALGKVAGDQTTFDWIADRESRFHADEVTYVSLGEGATSEGEVWEALNTACTRQVPVAARLPFLFRDRTAPATAAAPIAARTGQTVTLTWATETSATSPATTSTDGTRWVSAEGERRSRWPVELLRRVFTRRRRTPSAPSIPPATQAASLQQPRRSRRPPSPPAVGGGL